mmetsp:Transcript_11299/g.12414  ORF Transcript_11299/g.12414 Transcript_11299/m.12414 type:complete len:245 (-) Transcript_11299:281-1015(-)
MMAGRFLIVLVVLSGLTLPLYCGDSTLKSSNDDYDHYTFAVQWPAGICKSSTCNDSALARIKTFSNFTIHGLWPSNWSGSNPYYCDDYSVNWNRVNDDLIPVLDTTWVTLYGSWNDNDFRNYEWKKHGSCAHGSELLDSPGNYAPSDFFETALSLHEYLDIYNRLKSHGVQAGGRILGEDLVNAFKNGLGGQPQIQADWKDGKLYFTQVYICLSRYFEVIDCDGSVFRGDLEDEYFYFPSTDEF